MSDENTSVRGSHQPVTPTVTPVKLSAMTRIKKLRYILKGGLIKVIECLFQDFLIEFD